MFQCSPFTAETTFQPDFRTILRISWHQTHGVPRGANLADHSVPASYINAACSLCSFFFAYPLVSGDTQHEGISLLFFVSDPCMRICGCH